MQHDPPPYVGSYAVVARFAGAVFFASHARRDQNAPVAQDFSDAALVIVGHGSTLNADSSVPIYQHADAIRARNIFGQVQECFWKLEPSIAGVLRGIFTPRVFVVPLFISEGYFTEEVIPREFGLAPGGTAGVARVQRLGRWRVHYSAPVGTHPSMRDVILARAVSTVRDHPFPAAPPPAATSLFVAGHGTGNNENSRKAIEEQAERIRRAAIYSDVHAVFMEEEPGIADCYRLAKSKNVVVVPFFISDGLHSIEDIPVLLGESQKTVQQRLQAGQAPWRNPTERHGKRVWYTPSIGSEPRLADVIIERAREMDLTA